MASRIQATERQRDPNDGVTIIWAPVSSPHHTTTPPHHTNTTNTSSSHSSHNSWDTKQPAQTKISRRGWGIETGTSRSLNGMLFFSFFFDYINLCLHLQLQLRNQHQHQHSTSTNSLREKAQTMRDASFGPLVSVFFSCFFFNTDYNCS